MRIPEKLMMTSETAKTSQLGERWCVVISSFILLPSPSLVVVVVFVVVVVVVP